jgi:hypothetical protein
MKNTKLTAKDAARRARRHLNTKRGKRALPAG